VFLPRATTQKREHPRLGQAVGHGDKFCSWRSTSAEGRHRPRLNPRAPDWRAFVIAEAGQQPVGVAQVRRHPDGSRELATLVVVAEDRGRGIARRRIDTLLDDKTQPLFTLLDSRYAENFTPWGFQPIPATDLPDPLRRQLRLGQVVTAIGSLIRRQRIRLIVMRRPFRSQATD
jgi:amino-acid N-acetyltransferase